MSYEGYVNSVKGGGYERRAGLVHIPLFLWGDDYGRDKIFSQVNAAVLAQLAKSTGTAQIKASDFIYKNTALSSASYRFSKNVAQQCASFVRMAFFERRYESAVTGLRSRTVKKKKKAISLLGSLIKAKDGKHVGVLFGTMANSIQAFRTNMRDETGETKHTGYVVGIPHNFYTTKKEPENKRKISKLSFKKFDADYLKKNKKLAKTEKVYLSDKLAWLEHGTSRQSERRIYSMAIADFLKIAGFESGESFHNLATKPGTHKTKVKSSGKAKKEAKAVEMSAIDIIRKAAELELGIKIRKSNK